MLSDGKHFNFLLIFIKPEKKRTAIKSRPSWNLGKIRILALIQIYLYFNFSTCCRQIS